MKSFPPPLLQKQKKNFSLIVGTMGDWNRDQNTNFFLASSSIYDNASEPSCIIKKKKKSFLPLIFKIKSEKSPFCLF